MDRPSMKNHLQMENDAALESPFLQLSSDGWGYISKGVQKTSVGIDLAERPFLKA